MITIGLLLNIAIIDSLQFKNGHYTQHKPTLHHVMQFITLHVTGLAIVRTCHLICQRSVVRRSCFLGTTIVGDHPRSASTHHPSFDLLIAATADPPRCRVYHVDTASAAFSSSPVVPSRRLTVLCQLPSDVTIT